MGQEVDHENILALSQTCAEDPQARLREKSASAKLATELKQKKLQCEAKYAKKMQEYDRTVVQTKEMEAKLAAITNSNRIISAELSGLRAENERTSGIVEQLRNQQHEQEE